jgi:hypothetical protein
MKRRRISELYWAAATVTVSSGMLAAKLVIENSPLVQMFFSLS